jgi:hypothetical protein
VLIVGEGTSGAVVVTGVRLRIDASLKIEEVVKIAESSRVLVTLQARDGELKELRKTQNVSGALPSLGN